MTKQDLFKQDDFRQQYALAKESGDKRFGSPCQHTNVKNGYCTQCLRKVVTSIRQAWDAPQVTPDYVGRFQCYHTGLAGFFQAVAMLASQEIDPFCLDWEEANLWRELQDAWELAGGQS